MFTDLVKAEPIIVVKGANDRRLETNEARKAVGGRRKDDLDNRPAMPRPVAVREESPPRDETPPRARVAARALSPPRLPRIPSPPRARTPPRALRVDAPVTREHALEMYWEITDKAAWHNYSDGIMTPRDVGTWLNMLTDRERDAFKMVFDHYFDQVYELAGVQELVAKDEAAAKDVASHIAMTGQFMYVQYMTDPMWVQTLIDTADYQKLYAPLKAFVDK